MPDNIEESKTDLLKKARDNAEKALSEFFVHSMVQEKEINELKKTVKKLEGVILFFK